MNIIKVLEHMTGHSGPRYDKDIEQAVEKIRIHKESREKIAAGILQGICASAPGSSMSNKYLAKEAVEMADALIEELNK